MSDDDDFTDEMFYDDDDLQEEEELDWQTVVEEEDGKEVMINTNNVRYCYKKILGVNRRFSNPYDMCVDNNQELIFVCDSGNNAIQVFELNTYEWKYKIDCGADIPFYIEFNPEDSTILFGSNDNTLYKYSVFGKLIWKTTGGFNLPSGIAIDFNSKERNIYLCDQANNRILVLDSNGIYVREFGKHGSGNLEFIQSRNICFGNDDNLIITDRYNHRVQIISKEGKFIKSFGKRGRENGEFNEPCSVCVEKRTGNIYVSDSFNDRIQIFTSEGEYLESVTGVDYPLGISLNDRNGDLLVTEWRSGRVVILKDNFFISRYEEHIRRKMYKTTWRCDVSITSVDDCE